ncbi:MAG: tetratricopeptide repeat protein [Bacteroidales bacterium]
MNTSRSIPVRIIILVMVAVVISGLLIARSYYGKINQATDPRIKPARELYSQYDGVARGGNFRAVFDLLDSIERIYSATEHYRGSFETGVIENNRAAAFLTLALYGDSIDHDKNPFYSIKADSLVKLADLHVRKAIFIYESWGLEFEGLDETEIAEVIKPGFISGFSEEEPEDVMKFLENRVQEIITAQGENDRRLSVCRTNLGVVYRYQGAYMEAVEQYEMAIERWDRNLEAENNLNKLLNKPLKKRSIIQKIFPPERGVKKEI